MKIALIVFPFHPSHGCVLQTASLYAYLKTQGHEVTVYDRHKQITVKNWFRRTLSLIKASFFDQYKGVVFYRNYLPASLMKTFNPFIKNLFGNDLKRIYEGNDIIKVGEIYDAFIVGSDQTWRPKYVSDIGYFFLDFVSSSYKARRIAYAPSFGTDEWEYTNEQAKKCKELAQKFNAISVRESSGVKLCNKYFNVDAVSVLDPTMLLSKDDYISLAKIEKRDCDELSTYFLDSSFGKNKIAETVSKTLNLKMVKVNAKTEDSQAKLSERIPPSINRWLQGFANSKFIIADSFHATVFAIIFNVPFITIVNNNRGASRFFSLLSQVGLEDRMINETDIFDNSIVYQVIDWGEVNRKVTNLRNKSLEFLNMSLS